MRIGYGYDVHQFKDGGPLIMGGVEIPFGKSLSGHSDADVLLHAITDALLGACALGDLGKHFPDTSEDYEDIDSRVLLREALVLVEEKGFSVGNIDATVVAEKPRLASYIDEMRQVIAKDLKVGIDQISVKATTSEGLGFEGSGKGISARAVVLLMGSE
ncbi:2-C-methyl-D-erythritol 2,4-cyclodiphosphate synthase [Fodinibius sp. AD559]|uniref:2-C-methyl-D-erythritol 2,4-cyclodiphosphate synthase n=1 Tax=Fodinibius sp. AD559 TaxID=3424179 RepID=UPI00404704B2